jgi:pimeloyl-ACP methyl ester carboxylesterase
MKPNLCISTFGFRLNPTVILLAGAYSNSAMWPIPLIHGIVDTGFRVVTMEHRDFRCGNWDGMPFTMDDMVDDIHRTMMTNRIKCSHMLGASMGGAIALRFALKYPEHCKSLILYGTTPGKCFDDTDLQPPSVSALYAIQREATLMKQGYVRDALVHRFKSFSDESDHVINKMVKRTISKGINTNAIHGDAFLNAQSIVDDLKNIHQPSLIIHGEKDTVFPVEHAWKLHHEMPNSKLHILSGVDHYFSKHNTALIINRLKTIK